MAEGVGSFATPLDEGGSIREGLVTFAAFALCGVLPLLAYALSPLISAAGGGDGPASQGTLFLCACLVTAAALFSIGVVKVCALSNRKCGVRLVMNMWASPCLRGAAACPPSSLLRRGASSALFLDSRGSVLPRDCRG